MEGKGANKNGLFGLTRYANVLTHVLFYNYISEQFVGNYKNWVFAQPVKDWSTGSYKSAFDFLERLVEMGLVAGVGEGISQSWGAVYKRYFLDSKQSGSQSLEIPDLTPDLLPPSSSRD